MSARAGLFAALSMAASALLTILPLPGEADGFDIISVGQP
jgi:hypothetical protein